MTRAQRTQRRIHTPSSELAVCVAQESLRRSRKASRSTSSSLLARRPRAPAAPLTRHARRCACLGRRWSAAGAPAVRATPSGAALKLAVGAHSDAAMASAKTARETPPISSLQRPDGVPLRGLDLVFFFPAFSGCGVDSCFLGQRLAWICTRSPRVRCLRLPPEELDVPPLRAAERSGSGYAGVRTGPLRAGTCCFGAGNPTSLAALSCPLSAGAD
jgi:hypothetical protein